MAHTEYQKTHKVTLGFLPQDIDTEDLVGAPWSMSKAHHAAVIFNAATLTADVALSVLQGRESETITAIATGAGTSTIGIAGDKTAFYLATLLVVISGSTANDGIYIVSTGGATYAGGVTTIPIDETLSDATVDGVVTLVKVITGKAVTATALTDERIHILEVEASELDVANGYKQIVARAVAVAGGGYIGAAVHRFPLRTEPASHVT